MGQRMAEAWMDLYPDAGGLDKTPLPDGWSRKTNESGRSVYEGPGGEVSEFHPLLAQLAAEASSYPGRQDRDAREAEARERRRKERERERARRIRSPERRGQRYSGRRSRSRSRERRGRSRDRRRRSDSYDRSRRDRRDYEDRRRRQTRSRSV
eukprot:Hpha_TRINITY_DN26369_c0_g1::TRINITY_DN26369_c0_g1_i1::g.9303::m.9303